VVVAQLSTVTAQVLALSLNFRSSRTTFNCYCTTFSLVAQLSIVVAQLSTVIAQVLALSLNFPSSRTLLTVIAQVLALSLNLP